MLCVAIIGRPNVGKSTLFNRLVGKKLAIVNDQPGVTRDRKMAPAKFKDLEFDVIDTAGYEYSTTDNKESRMWEQKQRAINDADLCLFLFDARAGVQPYDELFADLVRQTHKPVLLLANKCEGKAQENAVYEAYKLGLGDPIVFSAEHGIGFDELYLALSDADKKKKEQEKEASESEEEQHKDRPIQIAFVGRPNVGKSTLVNALLGDERMLTGPEAGLTRDAVTTEWQWKDHRFNLVDTAGLRRKSKVSDSLEKMSAAGTKYAADMAQVVVLVLDADAVLDKQDLTIARKVADGWGFLAEQALHADT